MAMQTKIQVFHGREMDTAGIELLKKFRCQQKKINAHGIGYQFRNLEYGLVVNLNFGNLSNDLKEDHHQCRA